MEKYYLISDTGAIVTRNMQVAIKMERQGYYLCSRETFRRKRKWQKRQEAKEGSND